MKKSFVYNHKCLFKYAVQNVVLNGVLSNDLYFLNKIHYLSISDLFNLPDEKYQLCKEKLVYIVVQNEKNLDF